MRTAVAETIQREKTITVTIVRIRRMILTACFAFAALVIRRSYARRPAACEAQGLLPNGPRPSALTLIHLEPEAPRVRAISPRDSETCLSLYQATWSFLSGRRV